jgi:hypothetical protein
LADSRDATVSNDPGLYYANSPDHRSWEEILKVAEEEQTNQDLAKLNINPKLS